MTSGLIVVGTGIQAAGQLTIEARSAIEAADKVLYLVTDKVTSTYIERLNPSAESLHHHYANDKPRMDSYLEMVDNILGHVRAGELVCVALYGHPGVFAFPAHEAIRRARAEGHYARMTAGVSAEDCLFADLGVDPAWAGCQSFEATDFLVFERRFDPRSALVLWQVGVIGDVSFQGGGYNNERGLVALADRLKLSYPADHRAIIYEASHYPISRPRTDRVEIEAISTMVTTPESTLFVPPLEPSKPNERVLATLGLDGGAIRRVRMPVAEPA